MRLRALLLVLVACKGDEPARSADEPQVLATLSPDAAAALFSTSDSRDAALGGLEAEQIRQVVVAQQGPTPVRLHFPRTPTAARVSTSMRFNASCSFIESRSNAVTTLSSCTIRSSRETL